MPKIKKNIDKLSGEERELFLLRTKLEIRSWFLRLSIAFNIGMLVQFLMSIRSRK